MFSSSSSPSHLLSLAPPTMSSTLTTGLAGSKLSASARQRKKKGFEKNSASGLVNVWGAVLARANATLRRLGRSAAQRPGAPRRSRVIFVFLPFDAKTTTPSHTEQRCNRRLYTHPTPWSRASLEVLPLNVRRAMVRLSERIHVRCGRRGTVRRRRIMRCVCGQCLVAPTPRIKHNTERQDNRQQNGPVHVVSRVSEPKFGDSVICSGIFYRCQPMESVTRAVKHNIIQYGGGPTVRPYPGAPNPRHRHRAHTVQTCVPVKHSAFASVPPPLVLYHVVPVRRESVDNAVFKYHRDHVDGRLKAGLLYANYCTYYLVRFIGH